MLVYVFLPYYNPLGKKETNKLKGTLDFSFYFLVVFQPVYKTTISSTAAEKLVCPTDLVFTDSAIFERTCYFAEFELRSWWEAQESCQKQGATLLEIYSEDISNFIDTHFFAFHKSLWLGAREKSGSVVWTSGNLYILSKTSQIYDFKPVSLLTKTRYSFIESNYLYLPLSKKLVLALKQIVYYCFSFSHSLYIYH